MDKAKIIKISIIVLCAVLVTMLPFILLASCSKDKASVDLTPSQYNVSASQKDSEDIPEDIPEEEFEEDEPADGEIIKEKVEINNNTQINDDGEKESDETQGNKGTGGNNGNSANNDAQIKPDDEKEEEIYVQEPVTSEDDYEDLESEILSEPSEPEKPSGDGTNKETNTETSAVDSNVYTGKDYGDNAITKENLNFDGKIVTIMRQWDPYTDSSNNYWNNFSTRVAETEKKFNVDIVEKQWKMNLAAEMLAGTVPEGHLYTMGTSNAGSIYDMVNKGYIAYFDDAMAATGITMTESHYNKHNTELYNINGKQWSIGTGFARINSAVLYNSKLLQAAGYDVKNLIATGQWNWEKVTEIAKNTTVKDASGVITQWGIGLGTTGVKALVLSNGGHISYPDSNGKFVSTLDSENTKEALQQVYNWFNVDKIAKTFTEGEWSAGNTAFANGQIAIYFADNSAITAAYRNLKAEDYGVAYIPMGPKATKYVNYVTSGYNYVVPASYQKITTELLLLCDELHYRKEGYTPENEYTDLWSGSFHSNEQYNMWSNIYFNSEADTVWEGSDLLSLSGDVNSGFESIINGSMIPAVWVETNHAAYMTVADTLAETYKFTGIFE